MAQRLVKIQIFDKKAAFKKKKKSKKKFYEKIFMKKFTFQNGKNFKMKNQNYY